LVAFDIILFIPAEIKFFLNLLHFYPIWASASTDDVHKKNIVCGFDGNRRCESDIVLKGEENEMLSLRASLFWDVTQCM
jgi:hypothetical protein